jgi:hypothetical protein
MGSILIPELHRMRMQARHRRHAGKSTGDSLKFYAQGKYTMGLKTSPCQKQAGGSTVMHCSAYCIDLQAISITRAETRLKYAY